MFPGELARGPGRGVGKVCSTRQLCFVLICALGSVLKHVVDDAKSNHHRYESSPRYADTSPVYATLSTYDA